MAAGTGHSFAIATAASRRLGDGILPTATGLRLRFLLIFVGLAIAPILFVGLYLGHAGYTTVAAQSQKSLDAFGLHVRDNVVFFFEKVARELTLAGTLPGTGGPESARHEAVLQSLLLRNNVYQNIYLLDRHGTVAKRFSRTAITAATEPMSFADDSVFQIAAARMQPRLGEIRTVTSLREPLVQLAVPFADPYKGGLSHMIVADIRFKPVWDLLADLHRADGVDAYLVDGYGRVVAHRNPAVAMQGRVLSAAEIGKGVSRTTGEVLMTEQTVPVHDSALTAVVTMDRALAFQFADRFVWTTVAVSLAALATALIVFLIYERSVIVPLGRLLTRVDGLRHGNYPESRDIGGFGEVGILAESFDSLVDDLRAAQQRARDSLAELQKMNAQLSAKNSELIESEMRAEAASRTKSEFLANMSHELRTPLNAIIGFSEIIKLESFGAIGVREYSDYATDIHQAGHHLLNLINDILDLAKVESGKEELHEEILQVAELVDSAVRLLSQRAQRAGVEIDVAPIRDPPALLADRRKMQQVLINLLSNAVKFTESGGTVTVRAWSDPGKAYLLEVADTGIGIAAEDIPKALSQFGQVDSELSRKFDGTGLGLPLSKTHVELHGGSLEIQSEVGVGTTVTVRLPASCIALRDPDDKQSLEAAVT